MKIINQTILFLVFVLPANLFGQYPDNFIPDSASPPVIPGMTLVWNDEKISVYLDNLLLNTVLISETINPNGYNPFLQPHYILLNLAIGANGGDPSKSAFPKKYEVDWVRVYQNK